MEKVSLVDTLGKDEQQAIFKVIDLAVSNKKMKDNSDCFGFFISYWHKPNLKNIAALYLVAFLLHKVQLNKELPLFYSSHLF